MENDSVFNEVWSVIRSLIESWTKRKDIENLENYFHTSVVALVGSEKLRITGRTACADHWRTCSEKTIYSWQEVKPEIEFYSNKNVAIVSYEFNISLEKSGETINAVSRDSFALIHDNGKWQIILATV